MEYANKLTGAAKTLYRAGYNAAIHFGETPQAAHQAGLKQAAKIGKLRKLAQSGSIIKH
jgi:hypothetical protein